MRFTHTLCTVLTAAVWLMGCTAASSDWSSPSRQPDGAITTGTVGLGLSLGASGKIELVFGPMGTGMADPSPDAKHDLDTSGVLPVGTWTVEKGSARISLPADGNGFVKVFGLYENTQPELWSLLTAEGCAVLTAITKLGAGEANAGVVQRTYRLCGVRDAAARLRAASR